MFAKWIRAGFTSGRITTKYPKISSEPLRRSHGNWRTVARMVTPCDVTKCDYSGLCPTSAIDSPDGISVQLDAGACIGCGRCIEKYPEIFTWTDHIDMAATHRVDVVQTSGGESK